MEPERPGLRIEGEEQSAGTPPAAALPTASETNAAVGVDANPSDVAASASLGGNGAAAGGKTALLSASNTSMRKCLITHIYFLFASPRHAGVHTGSPSAMQGPRWMWTRGYFLQRCVNTSRRKLPVAVFR